MKSLYLRVWLTVVAVLALFAIGSGWLANQHLMQERHRLAGQPGERLQALAELIGRSLPASDEPIATQREALIDWAERLRMPMALDDALGRRLATSPAFERVERQEGQAAREWALTLEDGRLLRVIRPPRGQGAGPGAGPGGGGFGRGPMGEGGPPAGGLSGLAAGPGLLAVLALLFLAVAAGAYPVVRRLTRRLEALQQGVQRFGAGALGHRLDASGEDEVAKLAASFNEAADRVEALVRSHSQLVANASHELRSPLARLKLALGMLDTQQDEQARAKLRLEIQSNLLELDELIEELLMSSRLEASSGSGQTLPFRSVDVLALLAEEGARVGAQTVQADGACVVEGDERLLRRAIRNLLENARRYGQGSIDIQVSQGDPCVVEVLDRGAGVPPQFAERIFEPFFRLPGHAESAGGVGLGLALVRQIAIHHGGSVQVLPREGGGSRFRLSLPLHQGGSAPPLGSPRPSD